MFSGVSVYLKTPTRTITCGELIQGEVRYGDLVVPGCEVGRDGQSVDGAASAVPSSAPVPAVDDPPVGFVDDEIARTVRRVHLDGSL